MLIPELLPKHAKNKIPKVLHFFYKKNSQIVWFANFMIFKW